MAFASLSHFIRLLEDKDELIIVEEFVDPVLEISEITDRFSKTDGGGKALLFMNNGTDFPVLTNSMGSLKRLALAHGVSSIADISNRLEDLFNDFREPRSNLFEKIALLPKLAAVSGFFPSLQKGRSPAQEEIILDPDLNILPVLKTWPHDGGRFFTLPMVITTDPETGERNVGMYRMQVFDRQTTGMHWHRHKTGADHYEKYKKAGRKMPVAVALGGDPVFTYSATAPLPPNVDEFLFAGLLREKKVSLTKAVTQDILVPAEADIILEGYVDPEEDKVLEGPFGDHTGFYSLEDYYPKFHITAITHRKNAIYPATLVGIPPQEDAWIAKATERIFMMPIRKAIAPELTDMNIPDFGVAHNLALVKIKKTYERSLGSRSDDVQ
jgi:4-hydroxy-3-polyprenylbenzoate decarboxylase